MGEERAHLVVIEDCLGHLRVEWREAGVGEDRADRLETALDRSARIAVSEEREDVLVALEERCRKRERRVVGRLEQQLDDDARPVAGLVLLVESQPDVPGGARAPAEATVDPRAQAPLERRVPAVGGQRRVVRMERGEEALRGAVTETCGRSGPHPMERTARELVDRAAVEIVDERVDIAVEGSRADSRRGIRDLVQLVPYRVVDRRAPEAVPAAVARLKVRMDEPLCERAPRALHDRLDNAGRPAELEWLSLEVEQLAQRETSGIDVPSDPVELGDRGGARLERRRQERSGRVTEEREHAGVLLPEQLESAVSGRRGA